MDTLTLHVTYTAKEGCREQFVRQIVKEGLLTAIRAEAGCRMYDYYFSAQDENVVLLIEQWDSEAHQRIHMQQPHMDALRRIKNEYIASVRLTKVQEEPYAL